MKTKWGLVIVCLSVALFTIPHKAMAQGFGFGIRTGRTGFYINLPAPGVYSPGYAPCYYGECAAAVPYAAPVAPYYAPAPMYAPAVPLFYSAPYPRMGEYYGGWRGGCDHGYGHRGRGFY